MERGYLFIFTLTTLVSFYSNAQEKISPTQEEKEVKILNFNNIKSVLKNDGLITKKNEKEKLVTKIKEERKKILIEKYSYPNEEDFYKFLTELWLVKNAQVLQWDFPKPEYGIEVAFKGLLEKIGYYNKKIKILMVNSPVISHFALPLGDNEFVFLVSLPFIRTMDLTKVDIALLLLEDYFRLEQKLFMNNLNVDKTIYNKNFLDETFDKKLIPETLESYSRIIFKTGFNFQQQFEITKKMNEVLTSDQPLWGAYYKLLNKIDRLIKTDLLFKDYLKIYPSPELQLQWLKPKKDIL